MRKDESNSRKQRKYIYLLGRFCFPNLAQALCSHPGVSIQRKVPTECTLTKEATLPRQRMAPPPPPTTDTEYYTKLHLLSQISGPYPLSAYLDIFDNSFHLGPEPPKELPELHSEWATRTVHLPIAEFLAILLARKAENHATAVSLVMEPMGAVHIICAKTTTEAADSALICELAGLCDGNVKERYGGPRGFAAEGIRIIRKACKEKILRRVQKLLSLDIPEALLNADIDLPFFSTREERLQKGEAKCLEDDS